MIECYFKWCEYHHKDEPFCKVSDCKATDEQILIFVDLRKKELETYKEYNKND